MVFVKERQREKEQEIEGGWYTEERMSSELKYSAKLATKTENYRRQLLQRTFPRGSGNAKVP